MRRAREPARSEDDRLRILLRHLDEFGKRLTRLLVVDEQRHGIGDQPVVFGCRPNSLSTSA
jgi:hypothetical protein